MPKPVVSTEPSSHPLIPATSPRSQPTDPTLSSLSAGRGPQNVPESAQGQGQPDTAGHHGTTPSADPSNQAPVSPLGRAPWLFQKGNRYGQRRKPHKGGMAKYIQEQTMSGSMLVEFWLALASGQPFPMKRIVRLSMTSAQYAVAVGTATPEQRKIAKKQRRFIVVKKPYYPTVEDMKEAVDWLANRGFGKAPQSVPIESDQTTGFRFEFRPWPPGMDPASQRVIDEKTKAGPDGSSKDERIVGGPRNNPTRDT